MEVVGIRFPLDNKVYYYNPAELELAKGDWCVVETERGFDLGQVVEDTKIVERTKAKKTIHKVLRRATDKDLQQVAQNKKKEKEAHNLCYQKIEERDMEMKLVKVHFSLDASKITFFFTSETRIDFRDLVKDLAYHYKARIELRQIGVRDEAKMFGGYSWCGQPLCCATFLKDFASVTIKMAKDQNLILTPTKISGICGRLMCCLAYEHDYYARFRRQAPRIGTKISTKMGEGIVESQDVIKETIEVKLKDNQVVEIPLSELSGQKKGQVSSSDQSTPE